MGNNQEYYNQYELNKKLVSFSEIPSELIEEFMVAIKNTKINRY